MRVKGSRKFLFPESWLTVLPLCRGQRKNHLVSETDARCLSASSSVLCRFFTNTEKISVDIFWRNGENIERIGWSFRRAGREVALGAALFIPFVFGATLLERGLLRIGLSRPATPLPSFLAARGVAEFLLAAVLVAVVAVTEEIIFRRYLLLRFKTLLRSPALAVFLSSVIFSLGHGYEGSVGLVTVGVIGAVFAIIYLWRRSLVAPIVMHFLQNFLSIVLLPLLGMK